MDISELKESERARIDAENVIDTLREPILVLDEDLKVRLANKPFYRKFRISPGETMGHHIYDLGNGQWDIPGLRELLEGIIPKDKNFEGFPVSHDFPDIGHKKLILNARTVRQKGESQNLILLAMEDISRWRIEPGEKEKEED